jgi:glucosamine-6-phosphate deaminase
VVGRQFLLGCPTGRTPRPIYNAITQLLMRTDQDVRNLVVVMMDEYLVQGKDGFRYADERNPWACHHFVRTEMVGRWNEVLPPDLGVPDESIWFPDPSDPTEYDQRIAAAGGIDFFLLASGATDGHVAFNPPGSERHSTTRIITLSEETRRDNLQTFPAFGTLAAVPTHGISVGMGTIAAARESAMVVWGAGKRLTLQRIKNVPRYLPDWPATIIHECRNGQIICDDEASK